MSEDSSDLNFLCVWDGTIFTFQKRQQSATNEVQTVVEDSFKEPKGEHITFGFLGLAIFESEPWKSIKTQRVKAKS